MFSKAYFSYTTISHQILGQGQFFITMIPLVFII